MWKKHIMGVMKLNAQLNIIFTIILEIFLQDSLDCGIITCHAKYWKVKCLKFCLRTLWFWSSLKTISRSCLKSCFKRMNDFDVHFRQSLDHVDSRLGNTLGKKWSQPKNNHCLCCHCLNSIQPSCCGNWILASLILMLIRNIFLDEQSSVLWFCLPHSFMCVFKKISTARSWTCMFLSLNCLVVSFCHNPDIQFIFKLLGQKQFVMIHNLWTSLFINKQTQWKKGLLDFLS